MRFLFYQTKSPHHIGRGAVGYITGCITHPKTVGVILLYDCLNTPSAKSWRFFIKKYAEDKMKKHHYLPALLCLTTFIGTNAYGAADTSDPSCGTCYTRNPTWVTKGYSPSPKHCGAQRNAETLFDDGPTLPALGTMLEGYYVSSSYTNYETNVLADVSFLGPPSGPTCALNGTIVTVSTKLLDVNYYCTDGYYGTPTSINDTTCVACPANATCNRPNNRTFTCNTDYYKSGTTCKKCPSNATCSDTGIKCNQSYYLTTGSTCTKCPGGGITASTGHVKITDCFLYVWDPNASSARYYDDSGRFVVSQNCYYSSTQTPKYQVLGMKYF